MGRLPGRPASRTARIVACHCGWVSAGLVELDRCCAHIPAVWKGVERLAGGLVAVTLGRFVLVALLARVSEGSFCCGDAG